MKCQAAFIFEHDVRWNFAIDNLLKDRFIGHDRLSIGS